MVARQFGLLGATIVDADRIAADVLIPGSDALRALFEAFGDSIRRQDGGLDRSVMLQILIDDPQKMRMQLAILAPYILPAVDRAVEQAVQDHLHPIIVEAPLLFEYGQQERYGAIITVTVPHEIQIERLMHRSGRSREWALNVVDLQIPISEKAQHSDYIIDNSNDPQTTIRQILPIFNEIKGRSDLL